MVLELVGIKATGNEESKDMNRLLDDLLPLIRNTQNADETWDGEENGECRVKCRD